MCSKWKCLVELEVFYQVRWETSSLPTVQSCKHVKYKPAPLVFISLVWSWGKEKNKVYITAGHKSVQWTEGFLLYLSNACWAFYTNSYRQGNLKTENVPEICNETSLLTLTKDWNTRVGNDCRVFGNLATVALKSDRIQRMVFHKRQFEYQPVTISTSIQCVSRCKVKSVLSSSTWTEAWFLLAIEWWHPPRLSSHRWRVSLKGGCQGLKGSETKGLHLWEPPTSRCHETNGGKICRKPRA